jgi:hypothetical protein
MYGEGMSKSGELIDLGEKAGVVEKSGSWFSYDGQRIGQGRENAKTYLREHPEVAQAIENKVRENAGILATRSTARRKRTTRTRNSAQPRALTPQDRTLPDLRSGGLPHAAPLFLRAQACEKRGEPSWAVARRKTGQAVFIGASLQCPESAHGVARSNERCVETLCISPLRRRIMAMAVNRCRFGPIPKPLPIGFRAPGMSPHAQHDSSLR